MNNVVTQITPEESGTAGNEHFHLDSIYYFTITLQYDSIFFDSPSTILNIFYKKTLYDI